MQSATNNGVTTHYLVNALGQRVRKDQGTAATTTGYVYGEGNAMLAEYSWSGSGWKSYLWLGGQLIGVVRNNTLYYVHGDHQGRPEIVTDGAKNIVWRANNYAFDRTVTLDTIGGLNLGFPGQYYDAETGLWNNGFRDYDASVGRYVESDPLGLTAGINTFAYVGGNPIGQTDGLGLFPDTSLCFGMSAQGCMETGAFYAPTMPWFGEDDVFNIGIGGGLGYSAGGSAEVIFGVSSPAGWITTFGVVISELYGHKDGIASALTDFWIGGSDSQTPDGVLLTETPPILVPPGTETLGTIDVTASPADLAAARAGALNVFIRGSMSGAISSTYDFLTSTDAQLEEDAQKFVEQDLYRIRRH